MEDVFTRIYERSVWGSNNNQTYAGSSGGGSSVDYNKDTYIPFLRKFIKDLNIKTVVDLGCGDFRCGRLIYDDLDVTYAGYDTYGKVIEHNSATHPHEKYTFNHLDFFTHKQDIVSGDLCILKDVIQHWCVKNITEFLDYLVINKKFKYILICNCCNQWRHNTEIRNGDFRPLSCRFFPLRRYNPVRVYAYNTKEVSVIRTY